MKAKELNKLNADELNKKLKELKEELFNLRFQAAMGQLNNPLLIRTCRKDIARVQTIIRQRQINAKS